MRETRDDVMKEYDTLDREKIAKEFAFYRIELPGNVFFPLNIVSLNVVKPTPRYEFAGGNHATISQTYTVNLGTLLTEGKHIWRVRVDNTISSHDIGVVSPLHAQQNPGMSMLLHF